MTVKTRNNLITREGQTDCTPNDKYYFTFKKAFDVKFYLLRALIYEYKGRGVYKVTTIKCSLVAISVSL